MFKSCVGLGALLLALFVPMVMAQVPPGMVVSSISADDAGGIYNGSNVTLKVIVTNTAKIPQPWQAAVNIPAGYDFVDPNPCGGDFIQAGCRGKSFSGSMYVLVWPHGTDGTGKGDDLAPGTSNTCSVRLIATKTTTGQDIARGSAYNGPAFICGAPSDSKTYTFNTTATPTTDMAISLSSSASAVLVGSSVDYTLTASNIGRQTGTNVQAVFNFPSTLTVVPQNCQGVITTGGQSIGWNIGSMNYATSATCVLTATAQSGGGSNATVSTSISATETDPNKANNSASSSIAIVTPQADLSATISANTSSLAPGQNVLFTLTAANAGPQSAASTQLTGTFPPQLQLNSASCVKGAPSSQLVWNIGTLPSGASQSCTVQATLLATIRTSISASAAVTSATSDGNSSNNSASLVIAVQQPTGPAANIAISLAGLTAGHSYTPGEVVRLTVTATNTSSGADASGVVATLHLPNDGILTGFSTTCGAVDLNGKLLWSIGGLLRNSSQVCTITAAVVTATHAIPVSARIDAAVLGTDLDHLQDALVVPVNSKPKLISRTVSGAPTTKNSTHVTLNGDGSVALFQSQETNLVASNANANGQDIYRAGADGKLVLETLDSAGHQLIGTSSSPAISGDGSIVAFTYRPGAASQVNVAITTNMWAGGAGLPKHPVDTGMGGAAPNGPVSGAPSVATASGSKKLVFCSAASNLVTGDGNGQRDVFLVDPTNPGQATVLVSTDNQGTQLGGDSCEPSLSADGTKVVFTISAPGLYGTSARQVARKDLVTGKLEILSISSTGAFANADSSEPAINTDGSVIAFTSQASNLDTLGAPVGGKEAFVSLAQSGAVGAARTLKRLRSADGTVPNGASQHPQLSNDGTIVVIQTAATNFFGEAKGLGTPACGVVAISTNFFSPAAMGSALCNGSTSNQNPTISGDGTTAGFDSTAPQPGTSSTNNNAYTQGLSGLNAVGGSNFGGDLSGQWYDANQSGHGLVIDVIHPDAAGNRALLLTWFVYLNGQPSWVQGVGTPHAGTGDQAGMVVVSMNPVGIFHGASFPLGPAGTKATGAVWGSITLTFADSNTGTMSWTSSYPGFNSGTMAITHFLSVSLPAADAPGAQVKACYSGNWYNPAQSGHGFELEVVPAATPVLVVDWFAFGPTGAPVWLQGAAPISGNGAQVPLQLIDGSGAQFPPQYDPSQILQHLWGTATFVFTDATHATVSWTTAFSGYDSSAQPLPLQPLVVGLLDRRGCQ